MTSLRSGTVEGAAGELLTPALRAPFTTDAASTLGPTLSAPRPPPWPIRRRLWTAFAAIPVAFAVEGALVVAQKALPLPGDPLSLVRLALTHGAALTTATVALAWLSPLPVVDRLRLRRGAFDTRATLTLALFATALSFAFTLVSNVWRADDGGVLRVISEQVAAASAGSRLALAFAIGPVAALGEELLFRAYLQPRLEARWGAPKAIVVTAAIFAVVHLDVRQGAYAFLLGLVVGFGASRARSTRPAIVAHAVANSVAVLSVGMPAASRTLVTILAIGVLAVVLAPLGETRRRAYARG